MKNVYITRIYTIGIVMCLMLIAICKGIGGIQNYVYPLFLLELFIIICVIFNDKLIIKISKNEKVFYVIFICTQLIMFLITSIKYDTIIFDIHKLILFIGMIYACYYKPQRSYCTYERLDAMLNMLIIVGLIACLYNFVINIQYFRIGNLAILMHHTWKFSSFFFTRATYGLFLSFSAIATLVKSEKRGSKGYLIIYAFFVVNIIITAARAQIISVIIGSLIYLSYSKLYKKYVIVGGVTLVMFLAIYFGIYFNNSLSMFINKYLLFFDHSQGGMTDITTGRFYLWQQAIKHMDILSFWGGNGLGSRDTIMIKETIQVLGETLTSFHSGYIDLFFETGILGIMFYITVVKNTIKRLQDLKRKDIQHFFYSVIVIVLIANVFDSNVLLFTTDVFSPIVSVMVIALPNAIANTDKSTIN